MAKCSACSDPNLSIEEFAGEPCWAGPDLASRLDLTAYTLIFKREIDGKDHYYLFPRFYLPEDRVDDATLGHYKQW
jgi:phage terminase large subunit-like protein